MLRKKAFMVGRLMGFGYVQRQDIQRPDRHAHTTMTRPLRMTTRMLAEDEQDFFVVELFLEVPDGRRKPLRLRKVGLAAFF